MGNFKNKKPKQKRKKGKKFVYNQNQSTSNQVVSKANPFEEIAKKKLAKQGTQFKELIDEYKNRFNSNSFVDNRIGEGSKHLSYDDKMKLRFKAQQMVNQKLKKNKYSIMNDDDDDKNLHTLTHKGKEIDLNKVENVKEQSDDDQYYEELDNYRQELEENPEGVRLSRKEILQNIINKSKMLKMEKQKQKAENLNNIEVLDENFGELSNLLLRRKRTFGKFNDDYDRMANNYLYSKKTTPTDRIKSEKEILLENEMKLEKQNKQKIKDALLESDNDNAEREEHPDENEQNEKKKLTKKERIDKLIAERMSKSQKITKDEMINKGKKKVEDSEEEQEEDDMSDLKEFDEEIEGEGEEYEDEEGEEGEYEEDEEFEDEDEDE